MSTSFSDALAPLASRMPRPVKNFEILRVSAQLDGDDFDTTTQAARRNVLAWAQKRAGKRLPAEAWQFEEFEVFAGGRNSSAVRISTEETDLWALRAEDPDKDVPGRNWSSEVVIGGQRGLKPHVSTRLIVNTAEQQLATQVHVPGFILQLIDEPGLFSGSRKLLSESKLVESEDSAKDLCDHLEDPERRLPIVVVTVSAGDAAEPMIDSEAVARATAGLARVVRVPSDLTWMLTERFGKFRAVFNGAVRLYLPGFSVADDPYRHRLFVADRLIDTGEASSCSNWLRKTVAEFSVSSTRLGKEVLEFASVRTARKRIESTVLKDSSASDSEQLASTQKLAESLEKQLAAKDREIDGYVSMVVSAEARAETSEQEHRALLYRFRQLQDALKKGADEQTDEPPLPQDWSEFADWVYGAYPHRIALTPSARRMVRAAEFEDVAAVARSIAWLATTHHERRLEGGGTLRDEPIESGVRNAPCGGDSYTIEWKGRSYDVNWHVKNGGNTRNPRRCLRIYYFWEPETQQTVIDHLPSHRRTDAS